MILESKVKKQILGGLMIYFVVRIFAYFYSPTTPLYAANPINWIVSAGILGVVVYFLLKRDIRGWFIIAAEMILAGAGSFFEIGGIALRTILLLVSISIFLFQTIRDKKYQIFFENKYILYIFGSLYLTVTISAINGYLQGNALKLIIADIIPYLFFLYYFPLRQLMGSDKFRDTAFGMIISAIIGNFVFMYATLIGFSNKLFVLQDNYYHWFRDVASGKITDYATGFFRIVLNEQLLLVPLFLILFSWQLKNEKFKKFLAVCSVLLLAVLGINLTRIYFVALAIGILFLFSVKYWKKWFIYSTAALFSFVAIFVLTHLASTKGHSLGLEYLGLRLQSIAAPQIEDSSLSRMLLLPKILEKIKAHPVLGTGLGDTVTVYSPVFKRNITTPHFDWGYLEIMAETGIVGMAVWALLIGYCLLKLNNWILRASLISLLAINITSPALFHVMGIVLIVSLLAQINSKPLPLPSSPISSAASE